MEHDKTDEIFNALVADLQDEFNTDQDSIRVESLHKPIAYARDLYYAAIMESGALEVKDPEQVSMLQGVIVKATAHELTAKYPELKKGEPLYVDSNGEQDGEGSFVVVIENSDSGAHLASPQKLLQGEAIVGRIDTYGIIPLHTPQDEYSNSGDISNQWGFVILLHNAYIRSGNNRIDLDGRIVAIPLQDERLSIGRPIDQSEDAVHDGALVQDATYTMRHALQPVYLDIENQLNYEEHEENQNAREAHACARREAIEQLKMALDGIEIIQDTRLHVKAIAHGIGDKSAEIYSLDDAEVLFDSPNIIKLEDKGWRVVYELSLVHIDRQHQPVYIFPEMIESVIRLENQAVITDTNE